MLTGAAVAQAIPILGALILARIFSPGEFGVYASWLGIVVFMSVVITGRFETSLAIEADGDPRKLAFISTLVAACISSLALLILLLIVVVLFPVMLQKIALPLLVFALPTALTIAIVQAWQSWAAAEGAYRKLTVIRITNAGTITLSQIMIGLFQADASVLALGYLVGGIIACILCATLMPVGKLPVVDKNLSRLSAFGIGSVGFPCCLCRPMRSTRLPHNCQSSS